MSNILFSKSHTWVSRKEDTAKIGISDFAQAKLKSIVFLNLPDIGDALVAGEKFGDAESIKTVSDLISPVSGKVIKVNEELLDDPSMINEAPYNCWLLEVEVETVADGLLSEEEYKDYCFS